MPSIAPDNYFGLLTVMWGLVWLGFWSERNRIARKVPAVVWILVLAALLSNTGLIPFKSPLFEFIGGYIMPLAIPLLLYKATFARILGESGRVLPMFFIGVLSVCLGAVVGYYVLDLGPYGAHISATYAAAWIGGMTDMVAMAEITKIPNDVFAIAVSASAPVSVIGLAILVSLPSSKFIRRHIPSPIIDEIEADTGGNGAAEDAVPLDLAHMAGALALSAAICLAGQRIAAWSGFENYSLFIITLITALLANVLPGPLRAIKGDFELGMFAMYLFFAMIGAGIDATAFVTSAPVFFVLGMLIILIHIAVVLLVAKVLKFDLAESIIGSGANIVGAAAAAGIATSKGWTRLVTPAIAMGMLGKAIANFFGVLLFRMLS